MVVNDRVLRTLAVVGFLYFARAVVVPIVLAVALGLALTPLVEQLTRLRLRRSASVVLSVALALSVLGLIGWFSTGQITKFARTLPSHREALVGKTQGLGPVGSILRDTFVQLEQTVVPAESGAPKNEESPAGPEAGKSGSGSPPGLNSLEVLKVLAVTLMGTLGNFIIITVLLLLFLFHQESVGDRVLRLFGDCGLPVSGGTLRAAGKRVSRYLLTEFCVNLLYGGAIAAGAWLFGLQQPAFWGLLAFLFRFIPYIGTWLVAALAMVLSLASSDSWTKPLLLLGFWFVLELVTADLVEPITYGRRTGITPLCVMVSALFWSWVWGIAGLMIATPLTACLVQLGPEVPGIRWLNTLFGMSLSSQVLTGESSGVPLKPEHDLP